METKQAEISNISVGINEPAIVAKQAQLLYNELMAITGGDINTGNIVSVAVQGMMFINKCKELGGSQKKGILMDTLQKLINKIPDDGIRNVLVLMLENAVSPAIDHMVSFAKGQIKLPVDNLVGKILGCMGCLPAQSPK